MSNKVKKTQPKKANRYDEAEKVKFLNDYQELRNMGKNADVAAKEVGVPYITLRTWQKSKEVKPKGNREAVRAPAKGARAPRRGSPKNPKKLAFSAPVVVVLPDGTRIECTNAADAVAFIKANR